MAQFLRPISNITQSGGFAGNGSFVDLNEVTADDVGYIWTDDRSSGIYECGTTNGQDPGEGVGDVTVRFRFAKSDGGSAPSSSGNNALFSAYLYQGGTLKATLASNQATGLWQQKNYALTTGERASITDWDDLRVRIDVPQGAGGSPNNRRGVAISWIEIETPDYVAPTTIPLHVNVGDTWKAGKDLWVNVSDVWKKAVGVWVNVGGTWKKM